MNALVSAMADDKKPENSLIGGMVGQYSAYYGPAGGLEPSIAYSARRLSRLSWISP
jgi:hypothetical protein